MAVAERWLWKADKALTALLTATVGRGGLLQGKRQEWPQRSADLLWLGDGKGCAGMSNQEDQGCGGSTDVWALHLFLIPSLKEYG